ncbi:MAG: regulatory protein GemA [Ignavibacteria bacterium]|nr:regulatory protein GemA [Ignavibacteria bacterium]MCU7503816.1 regulatory protein GemA [Ignavibacteria bacterium]MCU7517170.1 regulatory protein GemA [Ignavibacteria bacterium]
MNEPKAYKSQIKEIHIAKSQINMSDEDYRACLESFGKSSSLELTPLEAIKLIHQFESLGYVRKVKESAKRKISSFGWGKEKYNCLGERGEDYPTPSQLRMLEALWRTKSREKSDSALQRFMKRITGKDDITWLLLNDVKKLKKAIQSL